MKNLYGKAVTTERSVTMARRKKDEKTAAAVIMLGTAVNSKGKEISVVSRSIRRYREQIGMEQKELARRLGIPASAVSNWETGFAKPNIDILVSVCSVLGITLYDLFGLDDPLVDYTAREQKLVAKYRELSEGHRYTVDRLIDSLGVAEDMDEAPDLTQLLYFGRQLAAGTGDPTDFGDDGEPIYLHSSALVDTADYVFTVSGDSMEPEYHNDDMVLVKRFPDCGSISEGEVGAFIIGNEAYIKEYRCDGLHSYNSVYKTMRFTDDDKVFFIGKVVGVLESGDIANDSEIQKYLAVREI